MQTLLKFATGLMVGLIAIAPVHSQSTGTVWEVELNASDKQDILALAKDTGISPPHRVKLDAYSSSVCTIVEVEGPDVVDGNQVRTTIVRTTIAGETMSNPLRSCCRCSVPPRV